MTQDIEIQITDEDIRNAFQQKVSQVANLELRVSALSRRIVELENQLDEETDDAEGG
jgi:Tfp pilus assembly protein PilO